MSELPLVPTTIPYGCPYCATNRKYYPTSWNGAEEKYDGK